MAEQEIIIPEKDEGYGGTMGDEQPQDLEYLKNAREKADKQFISEFAEGTQGGFSLFVEKGLIVLGYFFLIFSWPFQLRVIREYERGILFRLGKFSGIRASGLFLLLPFVDVMTKVDQRVKSLDVVPQTLITKDSVTIRVDAVVYYQVERPEFAIIHVNNYSLSTLYLAQTTLRSVIGQSTLDELLGKRASIAAKMRHILDEETEVWGVDIANVEIKDVSLPQSMQRAMAAQAEAERERRAKITLANAEYQCAMKLADAAKILAQNPGSIQLRYLQTLVEVSADKNHTNVIPIPVNLIRGMLHPEYEEKLKERNKKTERDEEDDEEDEDED